jgi:hypothetical protein
MVRPAHLATVYPFAPYTTPRRARTTGGFVRMAETDRGVPRRDKSDVLALILAGGIWPAQQCCGERWYAGTLDAVHQSRDLIEALSPKHVVALAGEAHDLSPRGVVLITRREARPPRSAAARNVA